MDLGTGPGPGKIVAAIWLITMTSKQLIPSYQAVPAAYGLIIGLCLAQCAVLCAQLLPPLTVKRVIDEGLATSSKSLSALLTMVHKEFARSHESKRFTHAPLRAHRSMMSTKSIPSKIAAEPKFLRSYVQAASGHGFHSADRLERADALQDAAQQSLDRLAMLPFLQAERPLGDLGNYAKCGAMLRDVLARALEMREAVPDLQPHADTRINRYRVELAPVFRTLTRHVCETVESAGKAASDKEALGRLKEQQQQLTAVMEATRLAVQETRDRHFGESFREAFRNGPVEDVPVRSILATHVVMQCTWQICLMVSTVAFGEAFVPYSSQPVLNTIKGWFNMWSNKAPVPRDYLRSHAFRLRLSNALIVSLAVCASLCFVYIPVLQASACPFLSVFSFRFGAVHLLAGHVGVADCALCLYQLFRRHSARCSRPIAGHLRGHVVFLYRAAHSALHHRPHLGSSARRPDCLHRRVCGVRVCADAREHGTCPRLVVRRHSNDERSASQPGLAEQPQ